MTPFATAVALMDKAVAESPFAVVNIPPVVVEPVPEPVRALDYFDDYAHISNSMLTAFAANRQEYRAVFVDKSQPPRPSTKEQLFGRAWHTAVLEPEEFLRQYEPTPVKISRRSNAGKAEFAARELAMAAAGKIVLDPDDIDLMRAMTRALRENPVAQRWLFGRQGEAEKEIRWTCPRTGLKRKAKLDWVSPQDWMIVDLKSTDDPSPKAWEYTQTKWGYHKQAAGYIEAAVHEYGPGPWTFLWLAVSKEQFPRVGPHILPDQALELGEVENYLALTELKECLETNSWTEPWSQKANVVDILRRSYLPKIEGTK